jgi:hypothetical protein
MAFFHVAMIKWKAGVTEAQAAEVMERIRDVASRVKTLHGIHWGPNSSPRAQGFTHAIIIEGITAAALDDYRADTLRQEASELLVEYAEDIVAADFDETHYTD